MQRVSRMLLSITQESKWYILINQLWGPYRKIFGSQFWCTGQMKWGLYKTLTRSIIKLIISHIWFLIHINKPFFAHFGNFQNTFLTLSIHISAKWHQKIKNNTSKLKFAHWQSKVMLHFWKSLLCCVLYAWSNRGTFLTDLVCFYWNT